uniref:polysaccharide biosynthesis C-terminal domain-containing protein n=1 Tax=Geoglobus acetivorans TaxID=565033 RepID=UPI00296F96F1
MMVLSLLIFRSALGFWAVLFNFKEMPEYPVYISFAGMLINVVLNYFFILAYGIVGAAIATVVSNAITWVAMAVASRRLLGIFFDYRDLVKPFISSAVMVLMLSLTEFTSLLDAVLKVAGGAMLYFGILFLVRGIGKEDVQYLRKVVAGRQK